MRPLVDAAVGSPVELDIFNLGAGHAAALGHQSAQQRQIATRRFGLAFAVVGILHRGCDAPVDFIQPRAGQIGGNRGEHEGGTRTAHDACTLFVARIGLPQGQRPLAQSESDQQQHDGEEHAVLAFDEHTLFGFEQSTLTLDAARFRAFSSSVASR